MADIIAVVDDPSQSIITATTSTGGTTIVTGSTLSNPQSVETLSAIGDVDTSSVSNGAVLVYKASTNKWTATTVLDAQDVTGGQY
jgi:hypothetical protein